MSEFIDRVVSIADTDGDSAEERLQHRILIATGIIMSFGGIVWGFVALALGATIQSLIPFGYVAATAANFVLLADSAKKQRVGNAESVALNETRAPF